MGNWCAGSSGSTEVITTEGGTTKKDEEVSSSPPSKLPDVIDESCTLGALLQSLMPIVLPIVRQVVSKNCVAEKMVLRDEKEIEKINVSQEDELIVEPLEFDVGEVSIVDSDTLEKDAKASPDFNWPTFTDGFCLDLTGVRLKIVFAKGIEFKFPVDGPFGMQADVEIGSGDANSDVKQAWIEFEIPKLRLWYSNVKGSRKAYLAFMARPKFTPNINVNVDRGKGDFMSMDFQEEDGLDDTIETILCGFGPSSLTKRTEEGDQEKDKVKSSWVADAIGARISSMMTTFAGIDGTDAPLEIDLEDTIAEAIRMALGKPRPVEAIEADLESLKAEKKSRETYVKPAEEHEKTRDLAIGNDVAASPTEAKKEDKIPENCSTGAFFRTLLPIILPVVRQVLSKNFVSDDMVLRNEEKVTKIDVENEKEFIIEPLELELGNTRVIQLAHYEKDTKAMPEFTWPRMTSNGLIWDIVNLRLKIIWADGIEFAFPVDGPMGMKAELEIGKGSGRSDVKQAWVELVIPRLRICYDNVKPNRKAYVLFLDRPQVTPNINVNVDRGKGDFMSMDFQEHDGLDDTIETILCGFGPSSVTKRKRSKEEKKKQKSSWIANGIGTRVSASLKRFGGIDGTDAPLEIDLEETMKMTIDSAMGIPRPVELIDADIELLTEELKVSKEYYTKESEGTTDNEEGTNTDGAEVNTSRDLQAVATQAGSSDKEVSASRNVPMTAVDDAPTEKSSIFDMCCGTGLQQVAD